MKNRFISAFLAFVMIFTIIPFNAFAADVQETTAVVSVKNTTAEPGNTVTVNVVIENNPGILGMTLKLNFDDSIATLKSVKSGDALSAMSFTPPTGDALVSGCNLVWDAEEVKAEDIKDGVMTMLTFEIAEEANPGDFVDIDFSYNKGAIRDSNFSAIDVSIESGCISILDYTPGDLNESGYVDANDVVFLRRYIAGGYMFDGKPITINEFAADVDDNDYLDSTDIVSIRRNIAGGYGVELLPHTEKCKHTSLSAVPAKEATCTEDGNIAYWTCDDCGKFFEDEEAAKEIAFEDTILTVEHQTTYTPEKEATTYAEGNIEYWTCSTCGKVFSDSAYENEITLADTIIQKLTGTTYTVYFKDAQTGKATFVSLDNQETSVSSITKDKSERYDFPQLKKYGYFALCLTDSNGNIITGIDAGTTGNVDVYVHWMSNRNQTRPVKELGKPQIIEDKENGQIYFVYEIGEIDNVPIEVLFNAGEIDEEMVHEKTSVKVKNTATENVTAIAETVAMATTKSASMTLSEDWTNKYSLDEEWAATQDSEKVANLKKYIEDGGQINISSQYGGEDTHTDTSGSSTTDTHKDTTGKVNTESSEDGGNEENQLAGKFGASYSVDALGVKAGMDFEISGYQKEGSNWKEVESEQNSSGTEDSHETTRYKDISDSYSNHWNTEEGYTMSNKIGTETDISTALRTVITENSKKSYSDEYQRGSLTTESQNISHNEGREYSAAITFSEEEEITDSTTVTLTFKTKGHYRFIRAGKLDVYAVVGYDIKNNTYSVSTFSMFEKGTKEIWDFSETGTFKDREIGVLPFEVPYEVEEYILGETAYTNGLYFDIAEGAVTRYVGTAKNVLVPNYYSKNGNMTYVKTLGVDPQTGDPLFAGNENIEVVRLSKYITSIPDGAFEGCTNLKTVIAPGVTSIGANAFNGCENLNKFIVSTKVTDLGENAFVGCPEVVVNASNSSVARAATTAGATRITINVEEMNGAFTDNEYADGYTINIGNIEYFAFYGGGKTFNNVKLISNAETTYIEKATFASDNGISLNINSENITFKGVNVKNDNVAMLSQFDGAKILIAEKSTFGSLTNDKTTKVISRNIELSNNAGETAQWIIDGTLYIYGNTEFTGKYIAVAKAVTTLSETEFSNYVKGVFTITLNPNGGSVATTSKSVTYGSAYGTLPIPTRTGYTFTRWTLSTDDATINENSVVSTPADHTLIARWNANSYTVKFNTNGGVCSTPSKTVTYDATYGDMPTPTREGHTFNGWYTAKTGGTKITSTTKVSITDEQTLYAQWTANTYIVTFNGNGGTSSKSSQSVTYGGTYGTLPTASKDYYDFNGWYTAANGGTKITSSSAYNTAGNVTLYAQWTIHPVSDWVLESSVPSGAEIIDEKWTYDLRTNKESKETSLSGYKQYDSYWVKSGSGSFEYSDEFETYAPGFDTTHEIYTSLAKAPYAAYENATTKREVSTSWKGYVYWHWMYNTSSSSAGYRVIYYQKGNYSLNNYAYKYFGAFKSTTDYTANSTGNSDQTNPYYTWYKATDRVSFADSQGSWWWYRFNYRTCSYTDYYKMFKYYKIESKESATLVTATDLISNVKHLVKYRAK